MIGFIKRFPILSAILFAVALMSLYHLAIGAISIFGLTNESLAVDDFDLVTLEVVDEDTVITETGDSQMHLSSDALNLYVKCDFSYDPGEFVVFYQNDLDKDFSADKIVYSRNEGDYYVFNLPFGTKKIRLDIGIFASVTVDFDEITLNKLTPVTLFRLSTSSIFYALLISLVASCIFMSIDSWKGFISKCIYHFRTKKR